MREQLRRLGAIFAALALVLPGLADDKQPGPQGPTKRVGVARCTSDTASFLRRQAPDKPWQIVQARQELETGDLLLAGVDASLESANGAVSLAVKGDMSGKSPLPILETAFVLNEPKDVDLDVSLDRGRIALTNRKDKGPAKVRVRIRERDGVLTLKSPGDRVAVEIYSRWPKGVHFTKEPKPGEEPALVLAILALKGEIDLQGKIHQLALKAPPGPALVYGDLVAGFEPTAQKLETLPEWARDDAVSDHGKAVQAACKKFRDIAATKGIDQAIDTLLASDNPVERGAAVVMMGAMDDLPRMALTLNTTKRPDVWDAGVIALRHWIGRGPGQDQKLYRGLIEKGKMTEKQAEIVMNLLHSFGDAELSQPETYEMLIDYLENDRLAIRGLAHWHLIRLVAKGKEIGYDPLADKAKRDEAVKAWRKLVPAGKLPGK